VNFLKLVADRQAPAVARGHVRGECADHGVSAAVTDTVVLLTSEVVTNAVLHGQGSLRLGADAHRQFVRVEVMDGSSATPRSREAGADDESGRGMSIVDALAAEWGVTPADPGKTVWFEVAEPGTAVQP
jgi:anti-sigma regulatory factor (Ser/Thr protein kinase)